MHYTRAPIATRGVDTLMTVGDSSGGSKYAAALALGAGGGLIYAFMGYLRGGKAGGRQTLTGLGVAIGTLVGVSVLKSKAA